MNYFNSVVPPLDTEINHCLKINSRGTLQIITKSLDLVTPYKPLNHFSTCRPQPQPAIAELYSVNIRSKEIITLARSVSLSFTFPA